MARQYPKEQGAQFEIWTARYLATVLDDDRIVRARLHGRRDEGDVAGVRYRGRRVVIECKSEKQARLWQYLDEADREAGNADALMGAVVIKVPGYGERRMGSQLVAVRKRTFEDVFGPKEAEISAGLFKPSELQEYVSGEWAGYFKTVSKRGDPMERAVLMSLRQFAGELVGGTMFLAL